MSAQRTTPFFSTVKTLIARNLTHIKRQPEMLTDVTIQPIMFVALFALVFGGSIAVAGSEYREWLLPGIMVQTMAFAAFVAAIGMNSDIHKGIIDRFRSLPIPSGAVLIARSISALIHSSIGVAVMSLTGLVVGWRIHTSFLEALAGYALLLWFGFSMIWVGILVGSKLGSPEAVNGVMFSSIFPITFVANTFAPTESMPGWLRTIAEWNPISSISQAVRELWGNAPAAGTDAAWAVQNPVTMALVWPAIILAFIAPLAIAGFAKVTKN